MDGVVEIITGRERRRRWSVDDKLRLVAETHEPGGLIRAVAARHGVCESLLYTWRRQARGGELAFPEMPGFVPVKMLDGAAPAAPGTSRRRVSDPAQSVRSGGGLIEIDLGNGQQLRVGHDVNLAALRRVLTALRA
jgi:transposase